MFASRKLEEHQWLLCELATLVIWTTLDNSDGSVTLAKQNIFGHSLCGSYPRARWGVIHPRGVSILQYARSNRVKLRVARYNLKEGLRIVRKEVPFGKIQTTMTSYEW